MPREQKTHYYRVGLSIPATWRQHIYTYSHDGALEPGEVVLAPFGKGEKTGYIVDEVSKPKFRTKPINSLLPYKLPAEALQSLAWLYEYYPTAPGVHVQHFLPAFLKKTKRIDGNSTLKHTGQSELEALTRQQSAALQSLEKTSKPAVLYGITGSGKTRLYAELAKKYIKQNKNILILYPEISLTAQLQGELSRYIDTDRIHVYHSKVTPATQSKSWQAAHDSNGGNVFIGPRSALFLPHKNLGAVIVDEAHDNAYKQDSGTRYHGLLVAGSLASIHGAQLLLASATPPVQETYQIVSKGGQLLQMDALAKKTMGDREFDLVDMTKKTNRGPSPLLSKQLLLRLKQALVESKQTLLFLNRRGTARMLLCDNCGWHAECPRCDSPLTYHHDKFKLQCHLCGLQQKAPISCPDCSHELTQKTPGVKAIEEELRSLFPDARIARFDSDNKKSDSVAENYTALKNGDVDIVLGTQLITKGLDLPNLEVVGILQADSALLLPDYTSEERAFQQLVQVSGRVGRGHQDRSHVVIQTYQPENSLFSFILTSDWLSFYAQEVKMRQSTGFPPFSYAMKVWASKPSRSNAEKTIQKFYSKISIEKGIRILGPAPSFYEKNAGTYSWQLVILSPSRKQLALIASNLPKDLLFDLDPVSLL